MSEASDEHFLRAWAERADETAFRALVGRYAGFVHGAALRRVGDAGLAQEITQDVFARLSQNAARLAGHRALSGWLHRSAMLIALDRLRHRRRYEARVENFLQMNTPSADPLAEALPHLDEALDQLAAPDREVLVLHFFDRLTFPEIAKRLGGSADATRMRSNRALSALSASLRKKGVTLSVTALATGLGSTFAQAAPATLVVVAGAAGAGKVSALSVIIHALQTMKTAKAAAVALLALVLATPLVFQQQQIAAAEGRIAGMERARIVLAGTTPLAPPVPNQLASAVIPRIDMSRLGADAIEDGYLPKRRIRDAVAQLDANNLAGLIEVVMGGGMIRTHREALLPVLLGELRKRDTALYLKWTMQVVATLVPDHEVGLQRSNFTYNFTSGASDAFRKWAASEPDKATAWASANRDEWKLLTGGGLDSLTVAGLMTSDLPRALAMLDGMNTQKCLGVLFDLRSDFTASQSTALSRWARAVPVSEKRRLLLREIVRWTPDDAPRDGNRMDGYRKVMMRMDMREDDVVWVSTRLALDSMSNLYEDGAITPEKEFAWVEKNIPANRQDYTKGALGHLFQPKAALVFLGRQLDEAPNDELIAGYVESEDMRLHRNSWQPSGGRHGDTAFKLATRVAEPARRLELLTVAWKDLHKDSAERAQKILDEIELAPSDRAALMERISALMEEGK